MPEISPNSLRINHATRVNSGFTKHLGLRQGQIVAVDKVAHTVSIAWMKPKGNDGVDNVDLTTPYIGFQSGMHFMPEVGSNVIVGFIEETPILLSYSPPSEVSNMLKGLKNTQGKPMRIRQLNEGEISFNSIQNAEIYIHDKVELMDWTGDNIVISPLDGSITLDSLQTYVINEAGHLEMGAVKRNGNIITNDKKSVTTTNGGNAFTEFKLTVNKYADNSLNTSAVTNNAVATITVGTVVDDSGEVVKDQTDKQIVCQIELSSGALVTINEDGKINMNEGNMLKPTEKGPTTQQRAAREGDRVTIPFTMPNLDKDHPQLEKKIEANQKFMQQIAPMILNCGIPCTFTPSIPSTKLVGEITQGSDSVFIGSLDKKAEQSETEKNE